MNGWIDDSDLPKLQSIQLGSCALQGDIGEDRETISDNERSDGSCRIVNCPKLKSIQIGFESFEDYHSFELNNLPSLQSIYITENCFEWSPSFSLTGLIDGLV